MAGKQGIYVLGVAILDLADLLSSVNGHGAVQNVTLALECRRAGCSPTIHVNVEFLHRDAFPCLEKPPWLENDSDAERDSASSISSSSSSSGKSCDTASNIPKRRDHEKCRIEHTPLRDSPSSAIGSRGSRSSSPGSWSDSSVPVGQACHSERLKSWIASSTDTAQCTDEARLLSSSKTNRGTGRGQGRWNRSWIPRRSAQRPDKKSSRTGTIPDAAGRVIDGFCIQSPDVGHSYGRQQNGMLAAELAMPPLREEPERKGAAGTGNACSYNEQEALERALEQSAALAQGLSGKIAACKAQESNSPHPGSSDGEDSIRSLGDGWFSKKITSRGQDREAYSSFVDAFFASMDQKSSSAGGEAACSTLAVALSCWILRRDGALPTGRGEFDRILRAGCRHWQNLCRSPSNQRKFPDLHFDLDTVLASQQQKIKIAVDHSASYVGFFRAAGVSSEALEDLLDATMPLEDIWREIDMGDRPATYIVGWNDHWFVVHVGKDGYCYLADTLGEKLGEGCDLAFMLRFPPSEPSHIASSSTCSRHLPLHVMDSVEACQHFLQTHYVAATLTQLEKDLRKAESQRGDSFASLPIEDIFRRLQIDFHRVVISRHPSKNAIAFG